MREKDGIDYAECQGCGDEVSEDMLEYCHDCDEGPFCDNCLEDHEQDEHTIKCVECKIKLDNDPPCPICNAQLCDDCFKEHVAKCKLESELGKQQRLLIQFPPFLCS